MSKDKITFIIFVFLLVILGVVIIWKNSNTTDNIKIMFTNNDIKQVQYTTPTGTTAISNLYIQDKVVGNGAEVVSTSTVNVHYRGWLENGSEFDKTMNVDGTILKDPISFPLSRVIKGWSEGLLGMKVGGTRYLKIPPELGYGENAQGKIPGNSTLYFEVKLLDVK